MRNLVKTVGVTMLALVLAFSMAACGGMSEKEYIDAVNAPMEKVMSEVSAFNQIDPESEDYDDQIISILEKIDGAFKEVAALEAPDKYADAQADFKTASEKMANSVSLYKEAFAMEEGSDEQIQKATDANTAYMEALEALMSGGEKMQAASES